MKDFLKFTLATITGLIVMGIIGIILTVIFFVQAVATQETSSGISNNTVLVIKLSGTITERTEDNPLASILGSSLTDNNSVEDIVKAVNHAKENDKVKGIYIEAGTLVSATPAALEEIRSALADFRKSKKFIVAYGDNYTQGTYYLSSVADSVIINPSGTLAWMGMSSQVVYYRNLLDKLGVKMQVFKVGTYKSAVEPYILDAMSDVNREQITTFENEIWGKFMKQVSESRGITAERLNALTDSCLVFSEAETYKKAQLVDRLAYADEVPDVIAHMMSVESQDDYHTASVTELANAESCTPKDDSGNIIAVYYATGEIVDEMASGLASDEIVGTTVIKDLKALAADDDVKAVVLRVNSPGGSAYASEQIWHQVQTVKEKKPVIVSMGGYAASGGYYISCGADWIVAEPTTLTGSIGIFGMFPEASELLTEKIGLKYETVKTNEFADFGDYSRPFNDNEKAKLQAYINNGYELFTKRCADGRHISQDSIKAIGEGRVWTGMHAKQIGLVDQLGGLADAIAVAKKKAGVKECTIMTAPVKASFITSLLEKAEDESYAKFHVRELLGDFYPLFKTVSNLHFNKLNLQAQLPYYLKFNL